MIRASLETDDLPDEQRQAIGQRHRSLYNTLQQIIGSIEDESQSQDDESAILARALLIASLLRSIADLLTASIPEPLARQEIHRATSLIART